MDVGYSSVNPNHARLVSDTPSLTDLHYKQTFDFDWLGNGRFYPTNAKRQLNDSLDNLALVWQLLFACARIRHALVFDPWRMGG